MIRSFIVFFFAFILTSQTMFSQEHEEAKHRVAFVLGHTYVSLENKEILSIPSFGLDYEYWLNNHWGLGLFGDVELISNEVSPTVNGSVVERHSPVVLTLDVVWNPQEHVEFVLGPGVVFEKGEVEKLVRLGLEYDLTLGHHWDVAPNIFYDQKLEGGYAISIGIGIGKSF